MNDDTPNGNNAICVLLTILILIIIGIVGTTEATAEDRTVSDVSCPFKKENPLEVVYDAHGFIEKYAAVAIDEYERAGIPPSITLAQGILESGYGRSMAATEHNAFFCIKDYHWDGESFPLKGSTYRAYGDAVESFIDHSNFLVKQPRYRPLFDSRNWECWADQLHPLGYAEDERYGIKLRRIIKRYRLFNLDK